MKDFEEELGESEEEQLIPSRVKGGKSRKARRPKPPPPDIAGGDLTAEDESPVEGLAGGRPEAEGPAAAEEVAAEVTGGLEIPVRRAARPAIRRGGMPVEGGATRFIILLIVAAALATLVVSIFHTRVPEAHWGFVFFLVIFTVLAQFDLRVKGGGEINIGVVLLVAGLFSAGMAYRAALAENAPFPAVGVLWIFLFGSLTRAVVRVFSGEFSRDELLGMLIDYSGVGLMVLAFDLVIRLPKRPVFHGQYWVGLVAATCVAAILYFLIQVLRNAFVLSQEGQFPPAGYVSSIVRRSWSPFAVLGGTGLLMGLIFVGIGMWSSLLVLPLLAVVTYAYNRVAATDQYLLETIRTLSRIPEETGRVNPGHAERVAELAVPVARELGLSPEDVQQVEYAAFLHDIGAITLAVEPDAEQRQLTETEGVIFGGVDIVGKVNYLGVAAEILRGREGLRDRVVDADKRRAVSMGAGILKAVDDFECLIQGSGTREPLSANEALTEMNLERGVKYDSKVLRAIARVVPRLPQKGLFAIDERSPEGSPFWRDQED